MPNYIRSRQSGATYFFTVVTFRRRRFLTGELARACLRRSLEEVREKWPFEQSALVLLPDHLHVIWTLPEDDDDFPIRWANIKRLFTKSYLASGGQDGAVSPEKRQRNERGIWQARFWEHRIESENELEAYRDYIHLNPAKHGYVNDPRDWPWSSLHRHLRDGLISPDWTAWTSIQLDATGE